MRRGEEKGREGVQEGASQAQKQDFTRDKRQAGVVWGGEGTSLQRGGGRGVKLTTPAPPSPL